MRYEQIKPLLDEEILDEVKMSPSALQKFANSPEAEGMLMGIEFEICVPGAAQGDDSGDGEYDYDMDERAYDIDDIINFFSNGDMATLGSGSAQRLRDKMWDEYLDWQMEKMDANLDTDDLEDRIRDRLREDVDWEDYVDAAKDALAFTGELPPEGTDEREQAINLKAKDLRDDYIDEELMGNSREYEAAYDDIRLEMLDEMRDDSDYDQESWLRDIGVDYMSEAEREWNLDWPHWMSYNEEGEVDVDTVGDEFGRAMGLDHVNTSSSYHGGRRDGKHWIIEPDSSIDAEEGDGGLEFVSPPMPIKDGLEMIKKFYKWAKMEDCYTNSSTGLHMNISVPDMTIEKLDYVKLALFLGDEHVLKQFGRQYNNYCKSAMSKIKERIKPEDVPSVLAQMKQHLNSLASKAIHSGITDKYTSINTKSNYVEFRGPGGDYLDMDPFEIVNTVLRLSLSLRIATDPESYKQEYAKKLYKLTEQEKDPDNSVKLFSQYAVGELPKEDLVARIKFARKGRELEKDKKAPVERLLKNADVQRKVDDMPQQWRELLRGNSIGSHDDQSLQSTINNLEWGEYDDELDPDTEVPLAIEILKSELAWREAQSEQKAFWVYNKDGTGGMQLVYANNENEAIIKGGKQMGMKREDSIVKLKAEEKTEPLDLANMSEQEFNKQVNDLPTFTLSKFVSDIKTRETSSLETALRNTKTRNITGSLTAMNYEFLQAVIERELKRRETEGETLEHDEYGARSVYPRELQDKIAAMPNPFNSWILRIPSISTEQLTTAKRKARNGEYDNEITEVQRNLLVELIDNELAYRDANGTGPMVGGGAGGIGSAELRFQPGTPLVVGTQEPANAQAVFDSLPNNWKAWLDGMSASNPATLQSVVDAVANGSSASAQRLSVEQKDLVISRIQAELRRRGGGIESEGEWPRPWNVWVANIQDHDRANLGNVRATMLDTEASSRSNLNDAQKERLLQLIDDEFRRRLALTISQGEEARAAQAAQQEFDFDSQAHEPEPQDPAVAQQSDLINNDEPVGPHEVSALQGTEDFEIRNPHTGSVVSIVRQGNLDYAIQKARQHEQDLGLEAGTLQVNRIGQTNESINTLRRLAGLV